MREIGFGLLILLIASGWGRANDSSYQGQGETVWPVGNDQIEMVSEKVVITYRPIQDDFYADCTFNLRNTGGPTETLVGFPDQGIQYPEEAEKFYPTIVGFKSWVDGKEVPVEIKSGIASPAFPNLVYKKVFVWKTGFKEGQTRTIRNTYSFEGISVVIGIRGADYILQSGKVWKGPIGKAEIIYQGIGEPFFIRASPGGYARKGNSITWRFDHFEPDSDIHVEFNGGCQRWLLISDSLLAEKHPNPDSLFKHLDRPSFSPNDSGVPDKLVSEKERKLLEKMSDGPLKDRFLYRQCLENGDTAQAVTRWISSLNGRYQGWAIWNPDGALYAALTFKVRFHPNPDPSSIPDSLRNIKPSIKRMLMRNAALNPDTGRFVRALKALENYYLAVWDTSHWFYGWPRLAVEYRGVGKFDDALRCYERGIAYKKRSALVHKIPVDTAGIAEIYKDMGQTMLYVGDTTKALPYLEKAMEYPRTPGGGGAGSMLKRIKEVREK